MAGQENFDDRFEKEWRGVFEGMRESPPSNIWNEIDRQLTHDELAVYKRRFAYFQRAAAAVVLVAAFSGLFLWLSNEDFSDNIRTAEVIDVDKPTDITQHYSIQIPADPEEEETGSTFTPPPITDSGDIKAFQVASNKREIPVIPDDTFKENQFNELELDKLDPELIVAANFEDKEIFKVATYDFHQKAEKRRKNDEKFWAGIGMGRSSFDPNFRAGESALAVPNTTTPAAFSQANNESVDRRAPEVREGMSAGETVALGLNFGVKMGDRWSLESGFQYMRSDATTTTNVVIETTSIREAIPASSEVKNVPSVQRAMRSDPVLEYDYQDVDLANEFQFATIPVKAGYLVFDSRFKVEINAGVAANVYLGNKLTPPDDQLTSVTFGPGDTSPYRELSFSGLAGVQLGYEFFDNFDLVVEPNYRRSINSITKDNSDFTASPSGFGVMTGIRYRFN